MARPIQDDGRLHGVVVGCCRDDGRWLLIRRGCGAAAAQGKVCFPGGAIEVGESQEAAVLREMREELGVEVEPVRCVWRHVYTDKPLVLSGWFARLKTQALDPDLTEVAETLWLTGTQAAEHPDALPYHDQLVAALVRAARDGRSL